MTSLQDELRHYADPRLGDIDWASCDYLGLAEHSDLNKEEAMYIMNYGNITFNRSVSTPLIPPSAFKGLCKYLLRKEFLI